MFDRKVLTLPLTKTVLPNQFCPRCGLVVPPQTKCIPSPSRPEVHYHPDCFYALAQKVGCRIHWA